MSGRLTGQTDTVHATHNRESRVLSGAQRKDLNFVLFVVVLGAEYRPEESLGESEEVGSRCVRHYDVISGPVSTHILRSWWTSLS